jgi:hypothetical protein
MYKTAILSPYIHSRTIDNANNMMTERLAKVIAFGVETYHTSQALNYGSINEDQEPYE